MFSIDCYRIKIHHLFHDMLLENKIKYQLLKYVYIVHDMRVADFNARFCRQFNDYLADIFFTLVCVCRGYVYIFAKHWGLYLPRAIKIEINRSRISEIHVSLFAFF